MASIINAARNIFSDNFWHLKLIIYSVPLYLFINNRMNNLSFSVGYIIIICLYLGVCIFLMDRNINNKSPLLPSLFDIPELVKKTVFGSVISLPFLIVYYFVINLVFQMFSYSFPVMCIIFGCVTMILAPFIILPTVYYSVRERVTDAYNLKLIVDGAGNFAVALLGFIIQYVIIFGFVGTVIYMLIYHMLKDTTMLSIFESLFIVFSFLTLYSYCSNLYASEIPALKTKE